MNDTQRMRIEEMRGEGIGYSVIAIETGLSKDSVKAYCRTHNLGGVKDIKKVGISASKKCMCCGKPVVQIPTRKPKKFCSDECRMKWWNSHPEMVKRKNIAHLVCALCGESFESKNPAQIYCSRDCYAKARKKAAGNG